MSRWIVQLVAGVDGRVHVVDNNGIAWRLVEGSLGDAPRWERLPALPSFVNPAPRSPAAADFDIVRHDRDGHDFPTSTAPTIATSNGEGK